MNKRKVQNLINSYILIIYDGSCGFCNQSIQFVLQNKPASNLRFVSSLSMTGEIILDHLRIQGIQQTIILVEDGKVLCKSRAIFGIIKYLNSRWKYIKVLSVFPYYFSDSIYDFISQHRYNYHVFVKSSAVEITSDLQTKFRDSLQS
ncbi:Predicted thiol-disulfide oxidoreductase YuxK, DCC family [Flavobacterium micromati]|uniref:Predicted thiol-disulfide oxidoreductase YuxK, DCC family n=1 Tax=Flavobacterium micromati TaxID=229205 RepID=A0A1M5P2D4_9FLAO|nr:Predicted thiol-disulfide oxidoreductase YuxK, DCC family [Flavobacterium micromati]